MKPNTSLAIPRSGSLVPIDHYRAADRELERVGDIDQIDRLRIGWIAFSKYLRKKSQRLETEKCARVMERRIGELLGPGIVGAHSKNLECGLHKDERLWFRTLAANRPVLMRCLENNVVRLHAIL